MEPNSIPEKDLAETPEDRQIVRRLEGFRPRPGPAFYHRMESGPWAASPRPPAPRPSSLLRSRLAFGIGLLALALFALLAASPAGRAAAERLARFFLFSDRDQTLVTVSAPAQGSLELDFRLSPAEAAAQAGFEVKVPAVVPIGFSNVGAAYLPGTGEVILAYETAGGQAVLRISQQPMTGAGQFAGVASSAQVEEIRVNGQEGEYVAGGWQAEIQVEDLQELLPNAAYSLEADWLPGTYIQVVRWAEGGILYEILAVGPPGSTLEKEALLELAGGLQ